MDELITHLVHFDRRLRLCDALSLAQKTAPAVFFGMIVIQILGHIIPIAHLFIWSLIPLVPWLIFVFLFTILRPTSRLHVAHRVDRYLGLKERLSTAIALQDGSNNFPPFLLNLQYLDALQAARSIQPTRDFPLYWDKQRIFLVGLMGLIILFLGVLPNPMNTVLEQRASIKESAQEQAKQVERIQEEIRASEALSPEEREEILRQLNELAQALRKNPGDLEQALSDFSKMEQALQEKLDRSSSVKEANLKALATQLLALNGEQPKSDEDLIEATSQALEALTQKMETMDEGERKALASSLFQMAAQATQAGNTDLANALSSLAQTLQSNDIAKVSQATKTLEQSLSKTKQTLLSQRALQQVLAQIQSSRQALAQASSSPSQASSMQGTQPGQSQGQGQGQSQPAGGGGTNATTLPPFRGSGKAGKPQGDKPIGPISDLVGQIYAPWTNNPSGSNSLFIPGTESNQGEIQVIQGQGDLPGTINPSLMPYYQVYYLYLNAANQAMQTSYIPISLLDYIQAYFTQLEP